MSDFYTVLTTDGMAEILDCVANNRGFKPATMAVGDSNGSYYEPEKTQIALKNPLYTGNIYAQGKKSSSEKSAGYLYFCFQVPPSVGNFVIREVGLFSPEGKLWAVAKYPETLKTKADETSDKTLNIEIQIELSDLILNTIVIDNSGNLVTRQTLEEYQPLEEKGKAEGYAPLDNEAKVPLEHLRGVFTTFCFNSGAVDKMGKPTLLEYKEELVSSADIADPENIVTVTRKIITLKAPATYTDGNGKTIVISEDLTLDVTDFEPGAKYSLRVVENNGVMDFFAVKGAEVYRQKAEPENPNPGDLWQNMSVAPELAYIRTTDDTWQITNEVEAGVYTVPAEGQELGGGGGKLVTNPYNHPIAALKKRLDNIETKLSPDYANGKPLQLVENLVQEIKEDCYIKGGIIDIKNNRSECSFNLGLCNMDGQVQEDLFTFDRAPMTAAGGGGLVRVIVETSLIKKGSYVKLYALAGLSDISIKVYPATGGITNV